MIHSLILAAAVSLAPPADIQRAIDAFVAKAPGVVVAVGVVDHDGTHTYFAGKPRAGAPPLNEATEFQIGSITKTMTSTVLAEMALRGQVKLDDPIAKYLPAGVTAPSYHGTPMTLLNLAEQNSGLPELPTNFHPSDDADPYAGYDASQLYDFLRDYPLSRAPGAKFEYSNVGVGLLGTLLANAAHTSYPQLVDDVVFKPLGMGTTSATLNAANEASFMPGFAPDLAMQPPWTFSALAGCGAVNSNLHDMLLYLKANIDAPRGPLGKAMSLAHEPRTPSLPGQRIGLNWIVASSGLIWHNGLTGGYSSFLGFDPASHVGVVVLTNIGAEHQETDVLGAHILESKRYPSIVAIESPVPSGASPYVGIYELSASFRITVSEENGTLYARATGQSPLPLTLQSGTTYAVAGVNARVTFVRDEKGNVTALVLHQGGVDRTAKRVYL